MNLEEKVESLKSLYLDKECINNTNKIRYKVHLINIETCPIDKIPKIYIHAKTVDNVIVGESCTDEFSVFLNNFTII